MIRAAFPYAAGVSKMSYPRFVAMATIGSIVWIGALGILGKAVGSQWQSWKHHLDYVDYVGRRGDRRGRHLGPVPLGPPRARRERGRRPRPSAPSMSPATSPRPLTAARALALGALHGPAELMPVSSSAHVTVIPYLLGWDYAEAEADLRKAFEVALHAGHRAGAADRPARGGRGDDARDDRGPLRRG